MTKIISLVLAGSILYAAYGYNGSTTAAVTIVGGIIKANSVEVHKKYKRKECPVCKGKGWYISGDNIKKVDCGYCEPDSGVLNDNEESQITHPPAILKPDCKTRVIKK